MNVKWHNLSNGLLNDLYLFNPIVVIISNLKPRTSLIKKHDQCLITLRCLRFPSTTNSFVSKYAIDRFTWCGHSFVVVFFILIIAMLMQIELHQLLSVTVSFISLFASFNLLSLFRFWINCWNEILLCMELFIMQFIVSSCYPLLKFSATKRSTIKWVLWFFSSRFSLFKQVIFRSVMKG